MKEERHCGECTLCCKTHGVFELLKPGGQWCVWCAVGHGCTIYSKRPKSCQDFKCAWLMGFGLPEYRPDKTHIVPDFKEVAGLGLVLHLWAESAEALDSLFVKRQTRLNLNAGKAVIHVPEVGNPKLYLPKGKRASDFAFRFGNLVERKVEVIEFLEGRF